jgi:hypothetical protein
MEDPVRRTTICIVFAVAALGACGGDDQSADPSGPDPATNETPSESTVGEGNADDGSDSASGDNPIGRATIDGTEYTIVASLQCLVAVEQANQISISGDVEEYESDSRAEWSYSWDSDDGVNEFRITVGDDPLTDQYRGSLSDPEVDGQSVTVSGILQAGVEPFDASFEIDCAG